MATDGRRKRGGRQRGSHGASRRRPRDGALDKAYLEALKDVQGEEGALPEASDEAGGVEGAGAAEPGGRSNFGEQQQAWVVVQAAKDGSEARLMELSLGGDLTVNLQSLMDALRDLYGITAGINEGLLGQLFGRATKAPASVVRGNFPIARSDSPQQSAEEEVEFLFAPAGDINALTFPQLTAALGEDDLQKVVSQDVLAQLVEPEQELARLPAANGDPAVNIYGKPLRAEPSEPALVAGGNARVADGTIISEIYGYVCLEDGRLSVLSPLWVSDNNMEAFFVRFPQGQAPPRPQSDWLLKLLEMKSINSGIDEPALEKLCRQDLPATKRTAVRIASAKEPVNGRDAHVDYEFDPAKRAGQVLEDGSIDLRERNVSISVAAGDMLGEFVPRSTGEPGVDLSGVALPATDGAERTFVAGENVRVEEEREDSQKFYAEIDGHVAIDGDTLHVRTVFDVRGDLDYDVGNIDVPGDVHISGSVKPGFVVKAGGSVTVGGAVELGASIHAKADVVVSQGILGDTTSVVALGDVETKHIQNSSVMAKGTITVGSYIFNARVRAGVQVVVKTGGGERGGSIVGGEVIASQGIQARLLGSPSTDRTVVGIGANPEDGAHVAQLEKSQQHVSSETMRLLRTLGVDSVDVEELKERIRKTPQPRRERVLEMMRKLQELEGKKKEILDSRRELQGRVEAGLSKAKITITEAVYTDVHFRFGDTTQIVSADLGPSVFLWSKGKIGYRPP